MFSLPLTSGGSRKISGPSSLLPCNIATSDFHRRAASCGRLGLVALPTTPLTSTAAELCLPLPFSLDLRFYRLTSYAQLSPTASLTSSSVMPFFSWISSTPLTSAAEGPCFK